MSCRLSFGTPKHRLWMIVWTNRWADSEDSRPENSDEETNGDLESDDLTSPF